MHGNGESIRDYRKTANLNVRIQSIAAAPDCLQMNGFTNAPVPFIECVGCIDPAFVIPKALGNQQFITVPQAELICTCQRFLDFKCVVLFL
jgi:hypothetical protein